MRGHVRKRGNKWAIVFYLGKDKSTQKKKYKWFSGYSTEQEAETDLPYKLIQVQDYIKNEIHSSKKTLDEFYNEWLINYANKQLSKSTLNRYYYVYNAHIKNSLGNMKLNNLSLKDIQNFVNNLKGSPSTVRKVFYLLKNIITLAYKWKLIQNNPCNDIILPKITKRSLKTWDSKNVITFLNYLKGDKLYIPFCLALTTGMRQGEICALEWKHYNKEKQNILIEQNMLRDGSIKPEPKTKSSNRIIKLMPQTIEALKQQQVIKTSFSLKPDFKDSGFICIMDDGRPMLPEYLQKRFTVLKHKYNLPNIRFHDLRHTFATLALKSGVNIKVLSEMLGHASVQTTMDIYTHVDEELQNEAIKKLQAGIFSV